MKRLRPHVDLAQYSKKYDGKVAKRAELFDEYESVDEFDDANGIEDDGGDDDDDDDYSGSNSDESASEDEDFGDSEEESESALKKTEKIQSKVTSDENIKLINTDNEELKKGKAVKSQLSKFIEYGNSYVNSYEAQRFICFSKVFGMFYWIIA